MLLFMVVLVLIIVLVCDLIAEAVIKQQKAQDDFHLAMKKAKEEINNYHRSR